MWKLIQAAVVFHVCKALCVCAHQSSLVKRMHAKVRVCRVWWECAWTWGTTFIVVHKISLYIWKEKSLRRINVEADTSYCRLSRMQGFVCMCAVTHLCVRNNKCVCVQIRQRKTNRCSCLLSTPGLSWPLSLAVLTGRTCTKL